MSLAEGEFSTEACTPPDQAPPCPICGHAAVRPFLTLDELPVLCGQLFASRAAAVQAPRGTIRLCFCPACGMIHNQAFDPGLVGYDLRYDNALHFSPLFRRYASELADRLIDRYDLRRKTVVEIGSGDGTFLGLLCSRGGNRGIGFDPSSPERQAAASAGDGDVRLIRAAYSEAAQHLQADFVCCRHVLEHVTCPDRLIASVRRTLRDHAAAVYFEVPDGRYLLANGEPWDVIYDHPSHFSPPVLRFLFRRGGFDVVGITTSFAGQYLQVEAVPASHGPATVAAGEVEAVAALVDAFGERARQRVTDARRRLGELLGGGAAVALWGAGAKGVTYLNLVDPGGRIPRAVDLNPRKHGMYAPGTGTPIVPPARLRGDPPDVVLFTNPVYRVEIQSMLDQLEVPAKLELV